MSPADRKKYIIAAAVVVVAIVVVVFVFRGRHKRPAAGAGGGFGAGAQAGRGGGYGGYGGYGGQGAQAGAPAAPGQAGFGYGGGGPQQPAAVAATPAAGGAPMLGVIRIGRGSEVRTRVDPFLTFEPEPVPTPVELLVPLPAVTLQAGGLRPAGVQEVAVGEAAIAGRRVSGLLFDEGAYAILEAGPGQAFVVKPGDIVQGYRVTAISRDSIFVDDPEGKHWQVRLRGLGVGGAASTSSRVGGLPESPPSEE
jgi:hypothetical protein